MAKRARSKARARSRGRAAVLPYLQLALRDRWLYAPLLLVALSALDRYVWVGALLSELGFLLALVLVALALACGAHKHWLRAGSLTASAAFFLWGSLPFLRSTRPTPEHGPTVRVAQAHAAGSPLSPARLASWLAQSRVELLSVTGLRAGDLRQLSDDPSGFVRVSGRSSKGELLLAKRSLLPAAGRGVAGLRLGRCPIDVLQVNLPSLFAPSALPERRRRIATLAAHDKQARRIYLGHFGSGSDSADLAPLRDGQEVRDARLGHGRLATAPAPLGPFGLPLDHILVHGWILVRDASSEPALAAGMHRTLLATLELTEPRCMR